MNLINQKNYIQYLDSIENNISHYERFIPKLVEFLKKDFPKTWDEMLNVNFPKLHKKVLSLTQKKYFSNKNTKTKNWIIKKYPAKTYEESLYRANFNIVNIPRCLCCNKNSKFNSLSNEYNYFCSLKCKIKFESITKIIDGVAITFKKYSSLVRNLTEERCSLVSNINLRGKKYHLDHKVSIYEAFKNSLPIDIAASVYNLEIISSDDNLAKGVRCSITIDELFKLHHSYTA